MDEQALKELIREAFARNEFPGDWCLKGSFEGEEPYLLESEFRGKSNWSELQADFLDQAPAGFGSALSFFSDEAFRFYLPAYLVADVDQELERVDVAFHLIHGLRLKEREDKVNVRRYGERTWFEVMRHKCSIFSALEVRCIIRYLEHKQRVGSVKDEVEDIEQALNAFWRPRLVELEGIRK